MRGAEAVAAAEVKRESRARCIGGWRGRLLEACTRYVYSGKEGGLAQHRFLVPRREKKKSIIRGYYQHRLFPSPCLPCEINPSSAYKFPTVVLYSVGSNSNSLSASSSSIMNSMIVAQRMKNFNDCGELFACTKMS